VKTFGTILISLVASSTLMAQSPGTKPVTDTSVSPSHLAAAEELLEASQTEKTLRDGMHVYFDAQLQQNPLMAPYGSVLEAFAAKYLAWSDLKPRLGRIYAQALTEEQLRAATVFQRSPAGQALVAHQAELQMAMMKLVQEQLGAHATELQAMIQARAAELNKPGNPPPPTPPTKKPR